MCFISRDSFVCTNHNMLWSFLKWVLQMFLFVSWMNTVFVILTYWITLFYEYQILEMLAKKFRGSTIKNHGAVFQPRWRLALCKWIPNVITNGWGIVLNYLFCMPNGLVAYAETTSLRQNGVIIILYILEMFSGS